MSTLKTEKTEKIIIPNLTAVPPEPAASTLGLDPDQLPTPEQLASIDFSNKPESLKRLDAEMQAAAREREIDPNSPFNHIYTLLYKGEGPIESIFFQSNRQPTLIQRDCQIWCSTKGYRYIKYKKAFTDILKPQKDINGGPPAGDVTNIVTRQSSDPRFVVPELAK